MRTVWQWQGKRSWCVYGACHHNPGSMCTFYVDFYVRACTLGLWGQSRCFLSWKSLSQGGSQNWAFTTGPDHEQKNKRGDKGQVFWQLTAKIKFCLVRMGKDSTASHVKFVQKVRESADPELVNSQRMLIDPLCSKVTVIPMVSHLFSACLHTVRMDGLHYTRHHFGTTRRLVVYCMRLVLTWIDKTRFWKCVQRKERHHIQWSVKKKLTFLI